LNCKVDRERAAKKPWYKLGKIKSLAWVILLADTIHNFADGMAIGASFAVSNKEGVSRSISIFCHEIPHELGNYAVLVGCGFTHIQAVLANFLSACVSFVGFYVAAAIGSDKAVSDWILCITAGMFYYISLVDLVCIFLSFFSDIKLTSKS
jgi:zinc transporter ZupT